MLQSVGVHGTPYMLMKIARVISIVLVALLAQGCGTGMVSQFPNRLIGADGQLIVREDVEAITSDSDLTDDERREALRNLGLEDETLIDALISGL